MIRFLKSLFFWSLRINLGGGGDGGAGEMKQQEEDRQKKVQAAVDAINSKFGIAPNGGAAPTREQFTTVGPSTYQYSNGGGGSMGDSGDNGTATLVPGAQTFDQAGYDAAVKEFTQRGVEGGRNVKGVGMFSAVAGLQGVPEWASSILGRVGKDPVVHESPREAMYSDISGAVRDTAMRDLDRQYSEVSQKNVFGLARKGLLGGSVDAEAGGDLNTRYGEGRLKAEQLGQQSGSDLRVQDEKTRQNLISLAQSGLDTGVAASLAEGQMASAADLARTQTAQATVGRLFEDLPQAYLQQQVMRARYPQAGQPGAPTGYGTSVFAPKGYTGKVQA